MNHRCSIPYLPGPRLAPIAACVLGVLAGASGAGGTSLQSRDPSVQARPSILSVTSCADDGSSGTLRSVVAAAATGDTVDLTALTCGTISLLTGQIEVHVDDLTINGPGRDALIVDGNYNGRVFHHDGAGTLTLSGMTVTHGVAEGATQNPDPVRASYGGCILSDNGSIDDPPNQLGSVTIIDSTVTGCRAHTDPATDIPAHGGGIHGNRAVTIQNSTISNCQALYDSAQQFIGGGGGGVFARYGALTVTGSLISANSARASTQTQMRGGGLSGYHGIAISDSVVTGNFVGCDSSVVDCSGALGGGVDSSGDLTVSGSVISDNIAEGGTTPFGAAAKGGGIFMMVGALIVTDSSVSGNQATGSSPYTRGGGMYLAQAPAAMSMSGVTFADNAAGIGGGIHMRPIAAGYISNSTISSNSAAVIGGGIYTLGSSFPFVLSNSTVTLNTSAGDRGGGGIVDLHDYTSGTTELESSIVAGNINTVPGASYDSDLGVTQYDPVISGANNLIVAANDVTLPSDTLSSDPMLGPLQNNGGPTLTHALPASSPAIDAGNNVANLDFDQRGPEFLRVFNGVPDIGAFELQPAPDIIFVDGFD